MTDTNTLRAIAGKTRTVSALAVIMAAMLAISMAAVGPVAASTHDVEINVNDADGNPVENATVDIIDTDDGSEVETGSTDADGYYETNLSDGDYDIIVDHADYDSDNEIISHTSGTVSTVDFSLTESTTTETGGLEITAEDTDGTIVENATVEVIDPDTGDVVDTKETDVDGLAAFTDLETGTYDVEITHADYQDESMTGIDVTADTTESYIVSMLEPGEQVEESQFDVDGTDGVPSSLYTELDNGTYDVTWYEIDSDDVRTDIDTETVTVDDGTTVHEFAPDGIEDASDGQTYGVEITYNTDDDADAGVVDTGINYDANDGGAGSGTGPAPDISDRTILGGVFVVVVVGGLILYARD